MDDAIKDYQGAIDFWKKCLLARQKSYINRLFRWLKKYTP